MAHDHGHMDHSHHEHHHDEVFHSHAPAGRMGIAFMLTCVILIVEFLGGLFSHSLALMADAGHVLTDVFAIGLSWFALRQGERPADESMTFGYHRSGILAAFINGMTLIVITFWILVEAYHRLHQLHAVDSMWMFISAGVGMLINLYMGLGMRHEEDLNVRSAVLHMLGDAVASAGVIIAGIIIMLTGLNIVDPLLSIAIALFIAYGAWRIVRQTIKILMEGTPTNVDFRQAVTAIHHVQGISDVHDVHLWSITSGKNALSCHVVLDGNMTVQQSQRILREVEHQLSHIGIGHVTIQIEDGSHPHGDSELCATKEAYHAHTH
ncbi:cation diffusion facilitator family transporter [Alicyclobacillus fodiniaquatilis]|uniref:Cation diffusion facilitator family transporter n=1 Tax=Alicyclobacillus fodiniaquatilis TaxID=1661150 RepID=A0ABW4JSJ0_9BACL